MESTLFVETYAVEALLSLILLIWKREDKPRKRQQDTFALRLLQGGLCLVTIAIVIFLYQLITEGWLTGKSLPWFFIATIVGTVLSAVIFIWKQRGGFLCIFYLLNLALILFVIMTFNPD